MTIDLVDIGYRPRVWQLEARAAFQRWNVLIVHRRGGKTVLADATLVDSALRTTKENGRYAYIAPELKQAKGVSWDYLKRFVQDIPGMKVNEAELSVLFPNGSKITLYGADSPDSLRGYYFDGVVIDEVADMKPQTWEEVLRPALADRKGWALFIGTPKGVNLLSEVYYRALTDEDWYAGLYDVTMTDALDEEEVRAAKKEMSPAKFRQEFMCDFGASSDNQIIALDMVLEASKRQPPVDSWDFAPKILGVDVARYGDDRSVIFRRQGLMSWEPSIFPDIDNMGLADQVAQEVTAWGADAVFIDAGRGEGVIDRLRRIGHRPVGVDFGGRPTRAVYRNKRAEMWHKLSEWLTEGGAITDNPVLKADLCAPRYSYANAKNVLELESKDAIRKRGLRSPDLGDALALTFAFPVGQFGSLHQAPPAFDDQGVRVLPQRRSQFVESDNPFRDEEFRR